MCIEERDRGFLGVGALDPHDLGPGLGDAVQQPRLHRLRRLRLVRAEVAGDVADDDDVVEPPARAALTHEELLAHASDQLTPPGDELVAELAAELLELLRVTVDAIELGVLELLRERLGVGRRPDHRDLGQARPRRLEHRLGVPDDIGGKPADRDQADVVLAQPAVDQRRVGGLAEVALGVELRIEVVGLGAGVVEVALETLLERFRRARDDLVSEVDPDQDPDRQRQEDGRERRRVVTRAIAH